MDLPPDVVEYQTKLHGKYIYNKETHEEYVALTPDGYQTDETLVTRIDLPVTGKPLCKLEINGRCLLEFQHIEYPSIEGKKQVVGRVTLSGSILPDGTLPKLTVVNVRANLPDGKVVLANWARKNLATWRFEPGKQEEAVRITYYFEVTDSPLVGSGVQFRLPSEVRVQTERVK